MLSSKRRNSIEAGSLPIESVEYRSVMSSIALVEIQPLSCEVFDYSSLHGLQICQLLKTSGHKLLRDWPATLL
ncbi:hypothetical protein TNCV_3339261 [Trichonephila clavipes]|nr:hypothetical protein TNCV_3339261 [Trichonephila clavipes]